MKAHPPLGRVPALMLALMIVAPYAVILIHFAIEPERFSRDALCFTTSLGVFPIFPILKALLGQSPSELLSLITSASRWLSRRQTVRAEERLRNVTERRRNFKTQKGDDDSHLIKVQPLDSPLVAP
jgi:hypothetical protein